MRSITKNSTLVRSTGGCSKPAQSTCFACQHPVPRLTVLIICVPMLSKCCRRVVGTQEVSVLEGSASRCASSSRGLLQFLAQGLAQVKAPSDGMGAVDYINPPPHLRRVVTLGSKGHKSWNRQILRQVHEDRSRTLSSHLQVDTTPIHNISPL